MRRLRHALSLWERLLPPRDRTTLRPLDRRLARLARLVGQVRDRDVMLALIEDPHLPKPPPADAIRVARLRARLRDDARTGRELLKVFLRSERDAHLFEELRGVLRHPPRSTGPAVLRSLLGEEEQRGWDRIRTARRKARRRPSINRLHRLRIRIRRFRHLHDLETRVDPVHAVPLPPVVRRLQGELGRLHDFDIVIEGLDPDTVSTEWGDELRRRRRRLRATVEESLQGKGWSRKGGTGAGAPAPRAPHRS